MGDLFSWIVTVLGLTGFYLAGKKIWWCWYINILNQVAWVIFAVVTDYYAFLLGTAFYFVVFGRNAYLWTKEHFDKKITEPLELVVKNYENQVQYQTTGCGNVSSKWHYACVKPYGHAGLHGYAGMFWGEDEGVYSLSGRVINNPPGNCVFSAVELPDGTTTGECRIEHIHVNRNPY